MISIVNQLSYNEKKIIANNQSINANTDGIKGRAHKFYNNIIIRYVSKVMVEAITLIISTMLIIFLLNSGIFMVKDMKKPYESYYNIFIF
jgi:hypothetical protein